ncbi:MAG TPA: TIR domain-containing protein [Thermoanaerobaculia bacterium]|nr:TIR domain-containing protein [Thermoanaerobaculia bacterium]
MDSSAAGPREFRYDAFISYSRKDREFSRRLEQELGSYRPPRDLDVPQRYLRIFRDEADFTGGEYHESLDRNLKDSAKLIVICSPNSASSGYVADEISRFAEHRGKEHIVPILLDGLPNNEAKGEDDGRRAFPEQLVRLLPMPLAADFRGFDTKGDKIRKGRFAPAWFKTLADVYADYGVDRAKIEQRERRRAVRRRRNIAAITSTVALVLAGLTFWALRQQDSSEARRLETEARLVFADSGDALAKATLLSAASVRFARTVDGQISLTRFLGLLPRPPLWRKSVGLPGFVPNGRRQRALAVSPDGARIAVIGPRGPVQLLDARTGQPVRSFEVQQRRADRTVLAFSPDGAFLVLGCAHQACVFGAASGKLLARLPRAEARHGDMVWSASFSPDGQRLAMSSYHSSDVLVYDVATWRTAATIDSGSSSGVLSVAFSPQGEWLATGAGSGLQLWRVGHYEEPASQVSTDLVWSIAFQPDGEGLIAAGRKLQEWRIEPGDGGVVRLEAAASRPIDAHTVLPVSWHDRSCFAAAAPDAIHLLCGEKLDDEVLRVPVSSAAAAISPDAQRLFNEQDDGTLAAWPLDAGPDAVRVRLGSPVRSMTTAEQRGWLAAGMDNGEIAVVDLNTWKERRRLRLPAPAAPVNKVIASPDGRWLVATQGTSLRVFDAGSWREVASKTYEQDVAGAAFDTGGRWLAAVTGTTVAVWQPGDWRERRRFEHDGRVEAVKVSPDGRRLATTTHWSAGHDKGVYLARVFDLASGNETGWEYTSGGGSNISEQFMRDEAARRQRALAGGDTASVQEAASSWPALELNEPDERESADGLWNVRVSGSVATLSDVAASREIAGFDQGGEITGIRLVPTRAPRWLVSAGEDGTLAVWPIRTDDLADQACARLRATLGAQALKKLMADAHAEGSCEAN